MKGTVGIWDAATGRLRHEIALSADLFHGPIHPDLSQRVALSPDGRMMATIGGRPAARSPAAANPGGFPSIPGPALAENEIRIVDLDAGRDRAVLRPDGASFRAMAFSPDGRWLATSLDDGTVRVYDATDGRERLPRPESRPVQEVGSTPGGPELINSLAFSPDRSVLAGCSRPTTVTPSPGGLYLWELDTGRQRRIAGFPVGPWSLAFSPDGRRIATAGGAEPMPRFWDVPTGREAFPQPGHTGAITALAAAADGTIFTGSRDGTVRRWDLATGHELGIVARYPPVLPGIVARYPPVLALAGSADGKTLIVSGELGKPVVVNVPDGRELHRLPTTWWNGRTPHVACSPDGRMVAFGRTIWDAATGRLLRALRAPGEREGFDPGGLIFFAPDGKRAITTEPGAVRTWDVATGAEAAPPVRSGRIVSTSAALSADGRFLATGNSFVLAGLEHAQSWPDGYLRVWELGTGREVAKLPVGDVSVSGIALSPGGRLLASFRTGHDNDRYIGEVRIQDPTIRDVATGRELGRLVGHRGIVNAVAFTPDGRSLVSAGEDATAMVWDVSDL